VLKQGNAINEINRKSEGKVSANQMRLGGVPQGSVSDPMLFAY
jgi:hypothetical protein